ncbi:hypothetical protein [Fibrobacter sp. UBA4309]|jgi:hypothetical protein|uniref:hypothetical protein n=1 Tax=Fibrobacter sp. UBA4309 TaxID=1946537 RepID=UPI0025C1A3D2|nr:hypothetical protein [Fibrobacter sp. UBA4309]
MRRLVFSLVLLTFAVCVVAAKPAAKIYGAVSSKEAFSGDRLFAVLDSVGGTGTWMEWDVNGVKDPSVMLALDPLLKQKDKPEMVWVLSERSKPLLAVLVPKGKGEVLLFYEVAAFDAKPEKLSMNRVLTPSVVFRDYRQVAPGEFVHLDKPDLKITANDKRVRFTYSKPDNTPLRFDSDYSKKTFVEKHAELRDYMDFLRYEYSLMLRAFVQSTRGMFNWQPWHWYMPEWNAGAFISEKELEAILMKGVKPEMFTLFKKKAAGGEIVEMRTSGNGFYEMTVTNP